MTPLTMDHLRQLRSKFEGDSRSESLNEGDSVVALQNDQKRMRNRYISQSGFSVNEFECLEAKKTWIERHEMFNLFDIFEVVTFDKRDLVILQTLASFADERFDATNTGHQKLLEELYHSAFGLTESERSPNLLEAEPESPVQATEEARTIEEVLSSQKWEKFGFQGPNPASDFRDGGVLALRAMIYLLKHDRVAYRIIREFNRQYENYLFACAVISSVQFLKCYFHFGVVNGFAKHMVKHVCGRGTVKVFLAAMRKLATDDERLEFFLQIACIFVKQGFRYWCEENAKGRLHVIDYGRVEKDFRKRWRKRAGEALKRLEKKPSAKGILEALVHLEGRERT